MADEDLIFGKKRHMYGGIEPSKMRAFYANVFLDSNDNPYVKITAKLPLDTIVNGQRLCTVDGCVIVKNEDHYPVDEFDGVKVRDIPADRVVYDYDVEKGTTYYYAAFPYTTQGVYNRDKFNRAIVITGGSKGYIFGYDLDTNDDNPETRVSYPEDVDNEGFDPAYMDYTSGNFNYGDWPIVPGDQFVPQPCMLTYDGEVAYYLNPSDYSKKLDGSASDVDNSEFNGNAMMEWPKIYTKRWEEDGIYHFRCSNEKIDDDYDCWCNYDKNNNEIDHFYTAIYLSSKDSDNKFRSICNVSVSANNNMRDEFTYAGNNGADWTFEELSDRLLIQDLLVMISRSTDTQTKFGKGYYSPTLSVINGSLNDKGLFWGGSGRATSVKIFGMENWWGAYHRRINGMLVWSPQGSSSSHLQVKITRGTHDGSSSVGYNIRATGYMQAIGYFDVISTNYISKMVTFPWGRIPSEFSGASTLYECDAVIKTSSSAWSNSYEVVRCCAVGGNHTNDEIAGAYCYEYWKYIYSSFNPEDKGDSAGSTYATALSYKPTIA